MAKRNRARPAAYDAIPDIQNIALLPIVGKFAIGGNPVSDTKPYDIILLITHLLGNQTHWQGRLVKAFQTGMLQQIFSRAVVWAYPEKADGPPLWELSE